MKTAHQRIQEISKVMKRAVEKAAEKHRLMGVPMVVWKDGKVVEFLPEPAREPHGNHLAPSVTFLEKKANPLRNELECDNTRNRLFPTFFMLKSIRGLLNINN